MRHAPGAGELRIAADVRRAGRAGGEVRRLHRPAGGAGRALPAAGVASRSRRTSTIAAVPQLRTEAQEKLTRIRPASLGQASRISGITPADLAVLLFYLGLSRLCGSLPVDGNVAEAATAPAIAETEHVAGESGRNRTKQRDWRSDKRRDD